MLFHVRMDIAIPHDLDAGERARLLASEKDRALELQRSGTWVHLWRVVGQYSNVSVFDVDFSRRAARHPVEPAAVPVHDGRRDRTDRAPLGAPGESLSRSAHPTAGMSRNARPKTTSPTRKSTTVKPMTSRTFSLAIASTGSSQKGWIMFATCSPAATDMDSLPR